MGLRSSVLFRVLGGLHTVVVEFFTVLWGWQRLSAEIEAEALSGLEV